MLIGNDLVDLRMPDARGKARDAAFIDRIFTPDEAAWIHDAIDGDVMLWRLWSAKEAAWKVARKLAAATPFAHRAFEIVPGGNGSGGRARLHDLAGLDDLELAIEWDATRAFVHCIAFEADGHGRRWSAVAPQAGLREADAGAARPLSAAELASALTAESRAVRRLAHRVAREAGLGDVEIVREPTHRGFGPPRLFHTGSRTPLNGWDVTLSHDGRLAAAALAGPITGRP